MSDGGAQLGADFVRGRLLVALGRFEEARAGFERLLEVNVECYGCAPLVAVWCARAHEEVHVPPPPQVPPRRAVLPAPAAGFRGDAGLQRACVSGGRH